MEGRRWVACDEWEGAYDIVKQRLESMSLGGGRDAMRLYPIVQRSEPLVRTDSGETSAPPPRMKRSETMTALVERDGMQCQGCGRRFDSPRYLELDRKMPRSEGGSNDIENRVLLCGPCNRTKSNTLTLAGLCKRNRKDGFLAAPLKCPPPLSPAPGAGFVHRDGARPGGPSSRTERYGFYAGRPRPHRDTQSRR